MLEAMTPKATSVAPPVKIAPTTHAAASTAMPIISSTLKKLHPLGSYSAIGLPRQKM